MPHSWPRPRRCATRAPSILAANARDMAAARAKGLGGALLDRLELNPQRVEAMAVGLETIAALADPVGDELARWSRPNGLDIARVRVPLGVVGIIYESRPNVTADAGAFASRPATRPCCAAARRASTPPRRSRRLWRTAWRWPACRRRRSSCCPPPTALPSACMLRMSEHIDVIVPRGGRSLIERVLAESKIPVLAHLEGNCHTYLHRSADPAMAVELAVNAKLRRTGVCGATETLLVDRDAAPAPAAADPGGPARGRLCHPWRRGGARAGAARRRGHRAGLVHGVSGRDPGGEDGGRPRRRHRPRQSLRLAPHRLIVAADAAAAERFLREVDSAIVIHNASTQFADGGEFGMGAEIGIATGRLHAAARSASSS